MLRQLTAIIKREGDGYVALCPDVDIASQGETVAEARDNLKEALELFFETASASEIKRRLHEEVYVCGARDAPGQLESLHRPSAGTSGTSAAARVAAFGRPMGTMARGLTGCCLPLVSRIEPAAFAADRRGPRRAAHRDAERAGGREPGGAAAIDDPDRRRRGHARTARRARPPGRPTGRRRAGLTRRTETATTPPT